MRGPVLIVSGDPSGDLHGSHLARAIKRLSPETKVASVGGPLLRAASDEFIEDLASQGITGFFAPLKRLPALRALAGRLKLYMRERVPQAVVCIDYYGFNRWVAELAKSAGRPCWYYISPQVWASRPGRVEVLRRLIDRMLVIFPFEEELYREKNVPVTFVGHPLLDHMPEPDGRTGTHRPLRIGLLPGSRKSELRRHLPVFLDAVDLIKKDFPEIETLVFASGHLSEEEYRPAAARGARVLRDAGYAARRTLDLAITSSGTATLENALLGVPMVVVYKMGWATYAVARSLIRVSHISMVNLLAEKTLVPELIQHKARPTTIARAAVDLLEDPRRYASLKNELIALRAKLGGPGASERAAKMILGIGRPVEAGHP